MVLLALVRTVLAVPLNWIPHSCTETFTRFYYYHGVCGNIQYGGSGSLVILREGARIPMNLMEILTFGIFLVDLIGLVYKLSKKK